MFGNDVNGDGTADADGLAAGDRVEHYYYAGWRVIEETDAASTPHVLAQTVYGTQYIDEPVCRDRNTDYLHDSGSSDGDCVDAGGSQRYFYHQDANFRGVLLTDESGVAVERYDYDAYGEPRIWACGTGVSPVETGSLLSISRVGNPLMHQGLRRDDETGLHENRRRTLHSRLGRFMQRDPLGYVDGLNVVEYLRSNPQHFADPLGQQLPGPVNWGGGFPNNTPPKSPAPAPASDVRITCANQSVITTTINSAEELVRKLRELISNGCIPIQIEIVNHGSPGYQSVGSGDNERNGTGGLSGWNMDILRGLLRDGQARIILWGCNVGEDQSELQKMSNACGYIIIANTGRVWPIRRGDWCRFFAPFGIETCAHPNNPAPPISGPIPKVKNEPSGGPKGPPCSDGRGPCGGPVF